VLLTLIVGGVFSNPIWLIWESIPWALDEAARVAPVALDVLVHGRVLAKVGLPRIRLNGASDPSGVTVAAEHVSSGETPRRSRDPGGCGEAA